MTRQTMEERLEQTFAVDERPRLALSNLRGSVTVQGQERKDVQVIAVKLTEGCRHPERTEVELYREGEQVIARTRFRPARRRLFGQHRDQACTVDYTVLVPAHCVVAVKQVQGAIHVSNIQGQVDVDAVHGAIQLHNMLGPTRVKGVSTNVEGKSWSGRARLSTVSGPIHVAQARLSHVAAQTVSGDLSLETVIDEGGHYEIHSVSGDVTLYLDPRQGIETRGTTLGGHLVCDLPLTYSHRGRGGWEASVNGGGPPVRFHSVRGDLALLSTTPQAPQ